MTHDGEFLGKLIRLLNDQPRIELGASIIYSCRLHNTPPGVARWNCPAVKPFHVAELGTRFFGWVNLATWRSPAADSPNKAPN